MKVLSIFIALLGTVLTYQSVFSQESASSIYINLGSTSAYTATNGTIYLPDQAWTATAAYGHLGGRLVTSPSFIPIGGTDDAPLYQSQWQNFDQYIVGGLLSGEYLVTLHFAELSAHGRGITQFDLRLENDLVLDDFDPFHAAGGSRLFAITYTFRVSVLDGFLNVDLQSISGEPHLAALSVKPFTPDGPPPAAPAGVDITTSFESVNLRWNGHETDVIGYHVYRSPAARDDFKRITVEPLRQTRFIDQFTDPSYLYSSQAVSMPSELNWHYQVTAVDFDQRESEPTETLAVRPMSLEESTLPVFQLHISEENWHQLNQTVFEKLYVQAQLVYEGETYPVKVRYRGNFTLNYAKKSWKIVFTDESPFSHTKILNLKSHYDDVTLIRGALTMSLYKKMGVPSPKTGHALLFVNDSYFGVYTDYEQINEEYLERRNLNPATVIYETIFSTQGYGTKLSSLEEYLRVYEIKTNKHVGYEPLIQFLESVSDTSDQFFATMLNRSLDVRGYLKYYAGVILTSNLDFTRHNVFLVHEPSKDEWGIIPWDPDMTWGHQTPFGLQYFTSLGIDAGARPNSGALHGPNRLLSRIMRIPEYKVYYCSELNKITASTFIETEIHPLIDAYHASVKAAAHADWYKYGWEDNSHFDASAHNLKQYATTRAAFLRNQMRSYCPGAESLLRVNEVVAGAQSRLCDPDEPIYSSCFDQWFELYNPGLEPVQLEGMYLTNDLNNPTKFRISQSSVISSTDQMLFWADDEPQQGLNHANFSITPETEAIALFDRDGKTLIDKLDITDRGFNVAYGRYPDGSPEVYRLAQGTPADSNRLATRIRHVYTVPENPAADENVTIFIKLFPDTEYQQGFLHYTLPSGQTNALPLSRQGAGLYSAIVPAQPHNTHVKFHLEVLSNSGMVEISPANAPTQRYEYLVGYQPPALLINELQAAHGDQEQQLSPERYSWFELHNHGDLAVNLVGMYLSDDLNEPRKYKIAGHMYIPAGGFTVFFANNTPDLSYWHTNFVLRRSQGAIYLFDSDENANQLITSYAYVDAPDEGTLQACVNNSTVWSRTPTPTPGYVNQPDCQLSYIPVAAQ